MNRSQIWGALTAIVARRSRLHVAVVRDEHRLAEDLGFDSLAFLLAVGDLERDLSVSLPLEQIDDLRSLTFRDLVDLTERQLARVPADD